MVSHLIGPIVLWQTDSKLSVSQLMELIFHDKEMVSCF